MFEGLETSCILVNSCGPHSLLSASPSETFWSDA